MYNLATWLWQHRTRWARMRSGLASLYRFLPGGSMRPCETYGAFRGGRLGFAGRGARGASRRGHALGVGDLLSWSEEEGLERAGGGRAGGVPTLDLRGADHWRSE